MRKRRSKKRIGWGLGQGMRGLIFFAITIVIIV